MATRCRRKEKRSPPPFGLRALRPGWLRPRPARATPSQRLPSIPPRAAAIYAIGSAKVLRFCTLSAGSALHCHRRGSLGGPRRPWRTARLWPRGVRVAARGCRLRWHLRTLPAGREGATRGCFAANPRPPDQAAATFQAFVRQRHHCLQRRPASALGTVPPAPLAPGSAEAQQAAQASGSVAAHPSAFLPAVRSLHSSPSG